MEDRAVAMKKEESGSDRFLNIMTNYSPIINNAEWGGTVLTYNSFARKNKFFTIMNCLNAWRKSDWVVVYQSGFPVFLFCLMNFFLRFRYVKVCSIDFQFSRPGNGLSGKLRGWVWKFIWRRVDLVICHMRYSDDLSTYFGIAESKFQYVPYKINGFEELNELSIEDEGYIFSGGYSWRDYKTFAEAMRGVDCEALIVCPKQETARVHGTDISAIQLPESVKLIEHDCDSKSWRNFIAKSRLVVIPVLKSALCSNGVSVYMSAMGMGKCVVITDCPAVRGVLQNGEECMIVPPGDPVALREVINQVLRDHSLRESLAKRGKEFAWKQGGLDEFCDRIVDTIVSRMGTGGG